MKIFSVVQSQARIIGFRHIERIKLFFLCVIFLSFSLFIGNDVQAGDKLEVQHIYALLGIKKDNKIVPLPEINTKKSLTNLPTGDYYLQLVIKYSGDNQYFEAFSYRIPVEVDNQYKGVLIDYENVMSLYVNPQTTRPGSLFEERFKSLSYFIIKDKFKVRGNTYLLSFLRKLLVKSNKKFGAILSSEKYELHRLHMLQGGTLNHNNIESLWQLIHPKQTHYRNKTIEENLNILINSLKDNDFSYSGLYQPVGEKNPILKYFNELLHKLRKDYLNKISPLKTAYGNKQKEYSSLVESINNEIKKLKKNSVIYKLKDKEERQVIDYIRKTYDSIKKSAYLRTQSEGDYKKENYKQANKTLKLAIDNLTTSNKNIIGTNNNIENKDMKLSFANKILVFIVFAILLFSTFIFMKTDFLKKHLNKQKRKSKEFPLDPKNTSSKQSSSDRYSNKVENTKKYNDQEREIKKLIEKNNILDKENKELKMDLHQEFLKMANDPKFISEFFNNPSVKLKLQQLLKKDNIKPKERTGYFKSKMNSLSYNSSDQKARHDEIPLKELTPDLVKEEQAQSSTQQPSETSISLLKTRLDEHRIIRSEEMKKEFDQVIQNDLLLAKSLSGWLKPNMAPSAYEQINTILENYENGKISLFIPKINSLFKPEEHDLTANREKEMRGKGAKVIKIVRPGVKMKEANGSTSIVSRAQVEIKT